MRYPHGRPSADPDVEDQILARLEALAPGRSSEQLAEKALKEYVDYQSWKADKIRHAIEPADAGDFAADEEMDAIFDRYRHAADASADGH